MKYFLFMLLLSVFLYSCSDTGNGVNDCSNKDCPSDSVCEVRNETAICICDDGFELVNNVCIAKNNDPCKDVTCSYHGNCVVQDRVAICDCADGYYAENLECKKEINLCEVNGETINCGEHGLCDSNSGQCICDAGYHYDDNSKKCEANNGCLSAENHCSDNGLGECKEDIEGDFWCECIEGYHEENGRCIENKCNGKVECSGAMGGCCEQGYACVNGNSCKPLGTACSGNESCGVNGLCDTATGLCYCENDENCGENQFCDTISGHCLEISDTPNDQCMFEPAYRENLPVLVAWNWDGATSVLSTFNNVIMPPIVAIFNDDNHDGSVDLKGDTPDVIFSSFEGTYTNNKESILRIVDGKTGLDLFDTSSLPKVDGGSAMAIGDLDNDHLNDIVTLSADGKKLIVFEYDINNNKVKVKWIQDTTIDQFENDYYGDEVSGAPAIADVDHDGNPEVLIGKYILNGQTGVEKCHSNGLSFGNNSDYPLINGAPTYVDDNGATKWTYPHRRYITVVHDYNNDGFMDIITGNEIISGRPSDNCQVISTAPDNRPDGYTAIADLDNDGIPEIVVVANGKLYIDNAFQYNLTTAFTIDEPFTNWKLNYPIGGAPTIANFDNDQNLEIAVAGADYYRVLKPHLDPNDDKFGTVTVLWEEASTDRSSRQTGSSLFDFDGDGRAEVLYADECYFRIYDGLTGAERFKIPNSSFTIFEYPIVVDVDGDGKSEVIVPANTYSDSCEWNNDDYKGNGLHGIRVFEDPDNSWLRTRQIWNQHSYHVTNVAESGKIPKNEKANWEKYNNYRQNVQGKGVFNAPNLVVENIDVKRENCPTLKYTIKIRVTNLGSISVPEGIPVAIYKGFYPNPEELLGIVYTQTPLWPGRREIVSFEFTPENPNDTREYNIYAVVDDEGNDTDLYKECNENDNRKEASFKGAYGLFCSSGKGQCMRFARYVCDANNKLVCGAIPAEPQTETCGDGLDNNCDGYIDENCTCNDGSNIDCYGGYATNFGENSRCKKGSMTCVGGESWTDCDGDIMPVPEICNGIDDDCNGDVDEIFDIGEDCYVGLGACRVKGSYVCDDMTGNQKCDANPLEATSEEICNNNQDDDCDGNIDERPCVE